MKVYLKLLILFLIINSCTSRHPDTSIEWSCGCEQNGTVGNAISCKPRSLDNGSRIYWNYDCYSSYIIFQNKENEKRVLYTLDNEYMELANRLGHTEFKEYKTTFLFTHEVISGCCTPPEYYLYDKSNGKLIKRLGRAIYVSSKKNLPIVVSLNEDIKKKSVVHWLTVHNLETGKQFEISLPKDDVIKGRTKNGFTYSEHLFQDNELTKNKHLIVKYYTDDNSDGKGKELKTIEIDLNKYLK